MYIKRKCTFGTKQHQVYRILGESSWTCHGQPSAALIGNRIGFPTSVHFPEETKPLDMILGRLKDTLQELDTRVKAYADEYKESMKYLSENKTGMDAMEIFSNQTSISQMVSAGAFTAERRAKIEKLIDSPYFARIDFKLADDNEADPFFMTGGRRYQACITILNLARRFMRLL